MSWEREFYALSCSGCGRTGTALWQQNDGTSFLRKPYTVVEVSDGFSWQAAGPLGYEAFFGRVLVCKACGGPASAGEVSPWPKSRRWYHNDWLRTAP